MNIKKEIKELDKLAEALENVSREWVDDTENEKLSKARYSLLDQSQLLACKIILQMIGVRATAKRIKKTDSPIYRRKLLPPGRSNFKY